MTYFTVSIPAASCDDEPKPAKVDVTVSAEEFGDDLVMIELQEPCGYLAVTVTPERARILARELLIAADTAAPARRAGDVPGEVYERDEPEEGELPVLSTVDGWAVGGRSR